MKFHLMQTGVIGRRKELEAGMAGQRDVVRGLVEAYAARPEERLDADLRADFLAAGSEADRLRVIVDQVASLTDVRALALHRAWNGHHGG